jgi:formate/nitrite transporter FocA (FNT family)
VLAPQQLFTKNTLEPVIPLLNDFRRRVLLQVLRLWVIVLAANMLGALAFAFVAAGTPVLEASMLPALDRVAQQATEGGFWTVAYRAVFAGWLIALMAWLVASTRATGAQIMLIWLTTAPIAAFGFRHSVAGSVEAFYRALRGGASWGSMFGEFLVPAVLGNIVGGVLPVVLLNHGQVAKERKGESGRDR